MARNRSSESPLVLLGPYHGAEWARVIPVLGFEGVTIPPLIAESMPLNADAVLSAAPPRFSLAGLCIGGHVIFEILRRAPERVSRVALINASARVDGAIQAASRRRRMENLIAARRRYNDDDYIRDALAWLLHHPSSEVRAGAEAAIRAVRWEEAVAQQTALMSRLDSLASVGMITAPTLVVAGERDRICDPGHSREISEQVPRSQLLIIPDCGHLAPIERPELIGKLLSDWMNWGD